MNVEPVVDLSGLTELGVERMQVVQLQPGDVVVLDCGQATIEHTKQIGAAAKGMFGEDVKVIALRGADIKVYRP